MRTVLVSISVLFLSMCAIGCSGEIADRPAVFPVTGTITYKGQPVAGALVTFSSAKSPRPANATTNSDGKYSLTTFNSKDGAVVGEHQVTITKLASAATSSGSATATIPDSSKGLPTGYPTSDGTGKMALPSVPKSELPAKYADATKSMLNATVKAAEKNEFTFDLED